ncbi:MAG: AMP-binding protein [Acidobacteriota bacterium]|nr:AMP-binding protein [Acidobacteriota bacterium]MDE2923903.1 AMP-binding protein [Acidobacteriota bacterium]MDE3264865.1 AMP-binding protein [Acidobacteriota bacterium]
MELARRVDRTRDALRRRLDGVTAPVVAVVGGAGPEAVVALLALLEDRVSFVLIHPRWTRAERDRAIALAGASLRLESGGALATVPAAAAVDNPSLRRGAGIVFTSGTTGQPRGAVLSRAAFRASARAHARAMGWRADDRWLLSLPTAHVGGLMIVVRCLHARRAVVVGGRRAAGNFEAGETLRVVERDRVTLLSVVPTMLARLLRTTKRPPPSLRAVLVGGAGAPTALMEQAREHGWPVFATYGLTEACSQVATERPGEPPGGVGTPLPGVEVRVAAPDGSAGTIQVRGGPLFDGYLGAEPGAPLERPFEADGWFDTGDLGAIGEDGRLRVVGRRTDRIVTGGENVDPAEVEAAVVEWPGAADVCVVGLEDEEWGEQVGAVLVPAAGFEALGGLDGLGRHLGGRLAGFKRPRCWSVVDRLPMAASGKVDRSACARLLVESPSQRAGEAEQ